MSIIGSNILAGAAGSGVSAYEIEQSLRFDGSSYLQRVFSSAGNRRSWTWSVWFKTAEPDNTNHINLSVCQANDNRNYYDIFLISQNSQELSWSASTTSGTSYSFNSNAKVRDPSAWYHVMFVWDSDNATTEDRVVLYLNGERMSERTGVNPSQNKDSEGIGGSNKMWRIGNDTYDSNWKMRGYMADLVFVDGQSLDPTDLGEYDNNGVWRPIDPSSLTFGSNGYYLKFDPSATNGIGHDHSGNGNNWTATGFTTSGTGTDVMSDTPTTNYATFNPLSTRGATATYSEGNLKSVPNQYNQSRTTIPLSAASGKFYAEVTFDNFSSGSFGGEEAFAIQPTSIAQGTVPNHNSGILGVHRGTSDNFVIKWQGTVIGSAGATQSGVSWTNLTIGLAVNFDDQEISGYWNDSLVVGPVDISTYLDTYDQWIFATTTHGAQPTITFNAGQRAFAYTLPTGYKALNTSNLPAPDIADGSKYFNTVLYTGNGTDNHAITGVGFQPSFTWLKTRSVADNHVLHDEVRGANRQLFTNNTDYEFTATTLLKSFDSDGFTLGTDSGANGSGRTFVAWNWLASNTSGSSNTDGSITSTVSVNATAGFSIVSYTASGTENDTVGHGLGVAPSFHIVKSRDGSRNWLAYTQAIDGSLDLLQLNTTAAKQDSSANAPTSTVFSIYGGDINTAGDKCIAYCFAEVEGYSKFGSYTGNNNNDGPFVFCGFKPSWLLIKGTNAAYWYIWDEQRSTYNAATKVLLPNDSTAEQDNTTRSIDFLSNGFKLRTNDTNINASGQQYIVAAFASNPFGGSGISPATAR